MNPLIAAEDLLEAADSPAPPVLLDVRWALSTGPDRAAYDAAHIHGARFVDLDADLAAPPGPGGRHPLPAPDAFEAAMRTAGVDPDSTVVIYDAGPATAAARAWWLLRHFGHRAVRVLDGGLARWTALGLPTESTGRSGGGPASDSPSGGFRVRRRGAAAGATSADDALGVGATLALGDVLGVAERGVLLDARAPERFRGETEPVDPVAGHIPGAVNAPAGANLSDDGTFLSAADLRRRFAELIGAPPSGGAELGPAGGAECGPAGGVPVAAYCGSGITAAHEVLALAIAGYPAALFPGSWSQWVADPARPVATASGSGTDTGTDTAAD